MTNAKFQSTLSVRRATGQSPGGVDAAEPISIHALREESDVAIYASNSFYPISIHALREESDIILLYLALLVIISIHALREESDRRWCANEPLV